MTFSPSFFLFCFAFKHNNFSCITGKSRIGYEITEHRFITGSENNANKPKIFSKTYVLNSNVE